MKTKGDSLYNEAKNVLGTKKLPFVQLKRITIVLKEDHQIHSISSQNNFLSSFDIVAAQPSTEKTFLACVQSNQIDVISFDANQKLNFHIKTSVARQALKKGIHFEINFNDALKNSSSLKNCISNARRIVEATKGKNIIISSGASEPLLLRAPYDFINLGSLFGMEAASSKKALSNNPRDVVLHAKTRNTYMGILSIDEGPLKPNQEWMNPETNSNYHQENKSIKKDQDVFGLQSEESEESEDDMQLDFISNKIIKK